MCLSSKVLADRESCSVSSRVTRRHLIVSNNSEASNNGLSASVSLNAHTPDSAVRTALNTLISVDGYLLRQDANERSITHRLAMHLQHELPEWHVDCEYNRNIESTDNPHLQKKLYSLDLSPASDDTDGKTVFPDIIAHQRGTSQNFLVIEVKKSTSTVSRKIDLKKLKCYVKELKYQHALFIELVTGGEPDVSYIEWIGL
jgi:hypothetical protein